MQALGHARGVPGVNPIVGYAERPKLFDEGGGHQGIAILPFLDFAFILTGIFSKAAADREAGRHACATEAPAAFDGIGILNFLHVASRKWFPIVRIGVRTVMRRVFLLDVYETISHYSVMREETMLIDQLGGPASVATKLRELTGREISKIPIRKWKQKDHVPWAWRPFVAELARRANIALPPDFIPFAPPAAESGQQR